MDESTERFVGVDLSPLKDSTGVVVIQHDGKSVLRTPNAVVVIDCDMTEEELARFKTEFARIASTGELVNVPITVPPANLEGEAK